MSANHTPGPWRVVRVSEYTDDADDTAISSIDGPGGETILFTDGGYFKPIEANARLIAAAPDLLEALEYMLRNNREMLWEHIARAAITKARGK